MSSVFSNLTPISDKFLLSHEIFHESNILSSISSSSSSLNNVDSSSTSSIESEKERETKTIQKKSLSSLTKETSTSSTSTSFLDDFFLYNPYYNINYLKNIISGYFIVDNETSTSTSSSSSSSTTTTTKENENKNEKIRLGLFQKSVAEYYKGSMENGIIQMLEFYLEKVDNPIAVLRIIFCMLIAYYPATRTLITRQLIKNNDTVSLEFFQNTYIKYCESILRALLNYPFYKSDINNAFCVTASHLVQCWTLKSRAMYIFEWSYEQQLLADQKRRIEAKKTEKKKTIEQTGDGDINDLEIDEKDLLLESNQYY